MGIAAPLGLKRSLNYSVVEQEKRQWHRDANSLGSLPVDRQPGSGRAQRAVAAALGAGELQAESCP